MLQIMVLLLLVAATPAWAETPDEVQARIFNSFLRTAIEGDTNSQFVVGHRYEIGVGTAQDLDQAHYWYGRAAERGHPLAKLKVEERKRAQAPAPESAPIVSSPPAPVAKPVPPKPAPLVANASKAPKEAKESKPPVERTVDALALVLSGHWLYNRDAAEYLPSAKASCLQASDGEVVCFSQELSRVVNNATLTYTVKASLSNFTKDGHFTLNYLYHVADIDKNRGGSSADQVAPRELLPKLGWQEPGHRLECRAVDENSIACMKDKKQIQFTKK